MTLPADADLIAELELLGGDTAGRPVTRRGGCAVWTGRVGVPDADGRLSRTSPKVLVDAPTRPGLTADDVKILTCRGEMAPGALTADQQKRVRMAAASSITKALLEQHREADRHAA